MNKGMLVAMAALVVTVLVGCGGNNTVPPPAPPPPITNQPGGFPGGGGGCGAVQGVNSFFSYLINVGQQQGGYGQQSLPSSLSVTLNQGQIQQGYGMPQTAQASGCFNWAELPLFYPQYPGQTQPMQQTGIPVTSMQPVQINPDGSFQQMNLVGQVSLPGYGVQAQQYQLTVAVAYGRVMYNQIQAQDIRLYFNGQPTLPGVNAQFVYRTNP